ncbi:MAG TPA: histidine phosphatase family protein [Pyrinomonadaceae bacterium]
MRFLYLLRHARAASAPSTSSDFDRPLTAEGRAQATRVGQVIAAEGLTEVAVITSPALRARETTELVLAGAGLSIAPRFEPRIYDAERATLLSLISEVDDAYRTLILVGHNPGVENLLRFFTREVHPVPPAALSKIRLEIDNWSEVNSSGAHLEWLV